MNMVTDSRRRLPWAAAVALAAEALGLRREEAEKWLLATFGRRYDWYNRAALDMAINRRKSHPKPARAVPISDRFRSVALEDTEAEDEFEL